MRIARLAAAQDGAVSREQLLALGVSGTTISRLVDRGVLQRVWPGVYRFGAGPLDRRGWWWAAVLAAGPDSGLFGRAACGLYELLPTLSRIDVWTSGTRGRGAAGLRLHRPDLRRVEITTFRGLPTTTVARTALDVAASRQDHGRLGELLDHALLAELYDHGEMLELLDARRGSRGVARLRTAVAGLEDHPSAFRSRAERRARDLLREAGLPTPSVNAWLPTRAGHGYELDLWWPALRLDVEIDGPRHDLPHHAARDRVRDADLRARGILVLRLRDRVVLDEPERFVSLVRAAMRQAGAEMS